MKNNIIEIKKIKNKKKYLDESFSVSRHYKQLVNNPQKKIVPYIRERIYITIGITVYVIAMILIFDNGPIFNSFIIGFMTLTLFVYIRNIVLTYKYISTRSKKESNATLSINEDKIVFTNNNDHITYECLWNNVKYILISKYCISFIPINNEVVGFLISIPIDYKNDCFKLFNEYKKIDLIIETEKRKK